MTRFQALLIALWRIRWGYTCKSVASDYSRRYPESDICQGFHSDGEELIRLASELLKIDIDEIAYPDL